jgi:hypothetical protein
LPVTGIESSQGWFVTLIETSTELRSAGPQAWRALGTFGPSVWFRVSVMSLYCDRCLTPFTEADCWPDITPPAEDWSEFCPSCHERKLKFHLEAEADRAFYELAPVIYRPRFVANS